MNFLSKIKSFFVTKEQKRLEEFFAEYLKIKSELVVSDIKMAGKDLNFKISWRGKVVPFWVSSKHEIIDITSSIATGLTLGLNLIEISQSLRNYD